MAVVLQKAIVSAIYLSPSPQAECLAASVDGGTHKATVAMSRA